MVMSRNVMTRHHVNTTGLAVAEWQSIPDLFTGSGDSYVSCASYTCGQWSLFHMMTLNPNESNDDTGTSRLSDNDMVAVVSAIRRFMTHFFGCIACRTHFLDENPLSVVATMMGVHDKASWLPLWLWRMHNSVNARLVHPLFPTVTDCPSCRVSLDHIPRINETALTSMNATGVVANDTTVTFNDTQVLAWLLDSYGYQQSEVVVMPEEEETTHAIAVQDSTWYVEQDTPVKEVACGGL